MFEDKTYDALCKGLNASRIKKNITAVFTNINLYKFKTSKKTFEFLKPST